MLIQLVKTDLQQQRINNIIFADSTFSLKVRPNLSTQGFVDVYITDEKGREFKKTLNQKGETV